MGSVFQSELIQITPLKDLPLFEVKKRLNFYQQSLQKELKAKGIIFDFHLWVSDEWFCPDGVPGFALPFYLFNPQLLKMHKKEVGFVEGESSAQLFKLLRHELGHALDNAFGLRQYAIRQKTFGSSRKNYPRSYSPLKNPKDFIDYLGDGYGQSHPDEDFAESFAYWLDPKKQKSAQKLAGAAKQKYDCVVTLMEKIKNKNPILTNKKKVDSIDEMEITHQDYYRKLNKNLWQKINLQTIDDLLKSSCSKKSEEEGVSLSRILSQKGPDLCDYLASRRGQDKMELKISLQKLIRRSQSLEIKTSGQISRKRLITLIEQNYRYLRQRDQLRYYL